MLKKERLKCYHARDVYFKALDDIEKKEKKRTTTKQQQQQQQHEEEKEQEANKGGGHTITTAREVRRLRKNFLKACPNSWVENFTKLRNDEDAFNKLIIETTTKGVGK